MIQTVLIFQGAAFLLFIIAAANVGNLLLTRTAGRRGELAIRLALGASRPRLVGMLFVEALPILRDLVELFPNNHDQKLLFDSF